ncbi:putative Anaerobic dehydrogenases [Desulfamplus magnetovallimortis]|uniref:Putative Anaerobic dehydrogenases n=1 Tax=Desulfamplus magnetovallimortis TaxID=1246637 RepID=A0A1W1HHC3_9BACT|nr:molybdopterin-dependent oxidoreductase [Desulfamplus magnetovallimortis]SLM31884.1 putative Anaerobic dehydrogenases [Desulfamplus magnetovallimortis]
MSNGKVDGVPSICYVCKENCGIVVKEGIHGVHISGNPLHPVSKGFLCIRGKNYGQLHTSPLRLQRPLLKKGSGWQELSYPDALALLAERLTNIKNKYGPESVVFYKGESLKHQETSLYLNHLAHGFGTPNYITVGSLCHFAMTLGFKLTCGGMPSADYSRIKSAIVWGANPAVSLTRSGIALKKAVKNGLKLVVVDPSFTRTAKFADHHLSISPGTDGFLALAFIKYAIFNNHVKASLKLEHGWNDLCEMVSGIPMDELLGPTGIHIDQFESAASLLFCNTPGWVQTGSGLELQPGGVQTVRAIASLFTILDPDAVTSPMAYKLNGLPGTELYPPMPDPIGKEQWPLFYSNLGQGQGMCLPQAILENKPYPIKAMVVIGGNPLMTFPDSLKYLKAFEKLEFMAVFDLFKTATARAADLILPGASFLENLELIDYGRGGKPYLGLIQPAVKSTNGWPTWKFIFRLAHTLGLGEFLPWQENEEAIRHRLGSGQISFDDLMASPSSIIEYSPGDPRSGAWNTPDGKIHYKSDLVAETGNPPLPVPESFSLPYGTDDTFPFWLSTGDRVLSYQHSQFRESPACRSMMPEPLLDIHPDTASGLGIDDGTRVELGTRHGTISIKVRLTSEVRLDSLRLTHGWIGANANELTGLDHLDELSGFPWMRAVPARIEKIEKMKTVDNMENNESLDNLEEG